MLCLFVIWDMVWALNVYKNYKNHIFSLISGGADDLGFIFTA